MMITHENVIKVANTLEMKKFNNALQKVQDYTEIAKNLMERYPEATLEELCEIFEREQEAELGKTENSER